MGYIEEYRLRTRYWIIMEDTKMCFAVTSDFKTLSYGEVELRELKENEVLVKVESAPINEVDSYVALGVFPHRIQVRFHFTILMSVLS